MFDLKLTARRHRRIIAVIAAGALLVPVAAMSAAGRDQEAAELQLQQELLAESVVTDVSEAEQVVRVDVAQDPAAAEEWLDESEVLDGWTVVVGGMDTKTSEERAALDAEAVAGDQPLTAEPCPDIPTGPRSADGGTTPYLGCGPTERVQATTARAVKKGSATTTLATAVDEVLASYLPGADLPPTKVQIAEGEATVDVAAGFEQALSDAGVYPGDVWQALLFTAHSNGAIDSVKFTLDGDCLAFAYATGGDMCASTDLPIELG